MDQYEHPFLRPDSQDVVDSLTDVALGVLRDCGSAGLSIRAIADRMNVTAPALTIRWRTQREGARARILRLIMLAYGDRWRAWSTSPLLGRHPSLALPATNEEREGVRAWLAFRELARSAAAGGNPDLAAVVASVEEKHRSDVRALLSEPALGLFPLDTAVAICALADGLRTELVAAEPEIELGDAARLLRDYVGATRTRRAG